MPLSVGAMAIVLGWLYHQDPPQLIEGPQAPSEPQDHVKFPSSLVAQLASQTANEVAYETSSGVPAVTITTRPKPTLASASASVTRLSSNEGGHSAGDVIVKIPEQNADILDQLIRQTGIGGKCKSLEPRSRTPAPSAENYNLINNAAVWVLPLAAPGQLLAALGIQLQQVPQLLLHLRGMTIQYSDS